MVTRPGCCHYSSKHYKRNPISSTPKISDRDHRYRMAQPTTEACPVLEMKASAEVCVSIRRPKSPAILLRQVLGNRLTLRVVRQSLGAEHGVFEQFCFGSATQRHFVLHPV